MHDRNSYPLQNEKNHDDKFIKMQLSSQEDNVTRKRIKKGYRTMQKVRQNGVNSDNQHIPPNEAIASPFCNNLIG